MNADGAFVFIEATKNRNGAFFPIAESEPTEKAQYRSTVRVSADFDAKIDPDLLAYRLRSARLSRKLSQAQLGEIVGVTNRTISTMETNVQGRSAAVPLRLLVRIADALRVDVMTLLEG